MWKQIITNNQADLRKLPAAIPQSRSGETLRTDFSQVGNGQDTHTESISERKNGSTIWLSNYGGMKPDGDISIEGTGNRNGTCVHSHKNIEPRIGNLPDSLGIPNGIASAANKNELNVNKVEEHAQLCFEEAFFLSHDTGCSSALDAGSGFSAIERTLFLPCG